MIMDWASLPKEVLGVILNKLSITDHYSFNFVCRHWYSAACEAADLNLLHSIPSPPWLLFPPQSIISHPDLNHHSGKDDNSSCLYYNPVNQKTCKNTKIVWRPPPLEEATCLGSCYGWLAFIDTKCVIYLQNPFRSDEESRSIIRLPPIETLPCIESVAVMPDGDIEYIYHFPNSVELDVMWTKKIYGYFVQKLVMSSAPSEEEECIVMMIYGEESDLAVCRIGDMSWTPLNGNIRDNHNHNLYYSASKKLFHVVSNHSNNPFEIWDFSDFSRPNSMCFDQLPSIPSAPPSLSTVEQSLRSRCTQQKYLAELNGKLLLVVRHVAEHVDKDGQFIDDDEDYNNVQVPRYVDTLPYKTFCFDAYEFDWSKQQWVLVNCLGRTGEDDVLFLGINNAMTFSTRDFPGMQSNSIYFTDDYRYYFHHVTTGRNYGGHDIGMFSFNSNSIDQCYYPGDLMKIAPASVWISPNPY